MMDLQEAIRHAREVASRQKMRAGICTQNDAECDKISNCLKCAEEHEQLAEWLEELVALREKYEKYRWHDLRKNPDDLPELGQSVLLVSKGWKNDHGDIYVGKLEPIKGSQDGSNNFWGIPAKDCEWTIYGWSYFRNPEVIAWREIEPFEEGE